MDVLAFLGLDLNHVQGWLEAGGYFVLFGLLFACGLGLPLPEDIPLLLGGYFVANGRMHLVIACVLAWLGIIGGDCVLYSLGRRFGIGITKVPVIGTHVTKDRILRGADCDGDFPLGRSRPDLLKKYLEQLFILWLVDKQ